MATVQEDLATTATGSLTITDPDAGEAAFVAETVNGSFGSLDIDVDGNWTYVLANASAAIQQLGANDTVTDTLTVTTTGGETHNIEITINGNNDVAAIGPVDTGSVTEDDPTTATGTLSITDTDAGEEAFNADTIAGTFGSLVIDASGFWTYTLDSGLSAVQELGQNDTLTDIITITSVDNTPHDIEITINGVNGPASIGGTVIGSVQEDVTLSASGSLTISDEDAGEALFVAETVNGVFGDLTIDENGVWTYALANGTTAVQELGGSTPVIDTLAVRSVDGTTQNIDITINGTNDGATIGPVDTGSVTEDDPTTATGTLSITDADAGEEAFNAETVPGSFGSLVIDAGGFWTYTLNSGLTAVQELGQNDTLTDTLTVTSVDGTTHNVEITVNGVNDIAVISGDVSGTVEEDTTLTFSGSLSVTDDDAGEAEFVLGTMLPGTHGTLDIATNGDWTYTLDNASAAVQQLGPNDDLTDTITVQTVDGTTQNIDILIEGINDDPFVSATISDTQTLEDDPFTLDVSGNFNDADINDTLDFTATLANGAMLPPWLTISSDGILTGMPENGDVGIIDITVTATDQSGRPVSDTFELEVINTNDAPTVENPIADRPTGVDPILAGDSVTIDLSNVFDDVDVGDSLTLTFNGTLPSWLTFDPVNSILDGAPGSSDSGSHIIDVVATDVAGESVTDTFEIFVTPTSNLSTVDGYISGALVFADTDADRQFDAGEASDTTDSDGDIILVGPTGNLVLEGGTDIASNKAFAGQYLAPAGSAVITPITTVIFEIAQLPPASNDFVAAESALETAFGIDPAVDLVNFDQIAGALSTDPGIAADGALVATRTSQINNTVVQIAGLLEGAGGGGITRLEGIRAAFQAIATEIDGLAPATQLDLTDLTSLQSIISTAATLAGVTLVGTDIPGTANILSRSNTEANTAFATSTGTNLLTQLAQTSIVAGDAADDLFDVGAGTITIGSAETTYVTNYAAEFLAAFPLVGDVDGNKGTDGADNLVGNATPDILEGLGGDDTVDGGGGADQLFGGDDADTIIGGAGDDTIRGDAGDDTLIGGEGVDDIDGGTGFDIVDYSASPVFVTVDLAAGTAADGFGNNESLAGIEGVIGSDNNDILTGNALDNTFRGGIGDDVIDGGAGNDTAIYTGTSGQYSISQVGNTITVTSLTGLDTGTDTLTNIEAVEFDAVTLNKPTAIALDNSSVDENADGAVVGNLTVTDLDDTVHTFSVSDARFEVVGGQLKLLAGQFLNHEPEPSVSVDVTATDGDGLFVTETFLINVNDLNDAPTSVVIPGQSTPEDSVFSLDVSGNFSDEDVGDSLSFSVELAAGGSVPGWLTITPAGVLSGTPENADVGVIDVRVVASDGTVTTSQVFQLTVQNVNDAPVVTAQIADTSTNEDAPFNLDVSGNFADDDIINGDSLTFSAELDGGGSPPSWLMFSSAGVFTGTPENADVGTLNIRVTATDNALVSVSDVFELVINNTNDPALIGGTDTGAVTEDTAVSTMGTLTISDPDVGESAFTPATGLAGTFGTLDIDAAGVWSYSLNNASAAVQSLGAGTTVQDTITVSSVDGTTHDIIIDVNGTNDGAVIGGVDSGTVTEDTALSVSNTLTISDADTGEANFVPATGLVGTYGSLDIAANGAWTYNLDNTNASVQALAAGAMLMDTITVSSDDGTTHNIDITINGTNDGAIIGGTDTGVVTEDVTLTANGLLTITDVDTGQATFTAATGLVGTFGTLDINASGDWTYFLDNANATVQALDINQTLNDTVTITSVDGTTHDIDITIHGTAEGFTIFGTPGDDNLVGTAGADTIQAFAGNDTVSGFGDDDTIFGGDGNDILDGGAGNDIIDGGTGLNTFVNSAGDDTLIGGTRGLSGATNTPSIDANFGDYRNATAGITVVQTGALGTALSSVTGDASVGTDTLDGIEIILGSDFDDTYTVDATYRGQFGGFNEFQPGAGNDVINATFDVFTRVGYADALDSVTVDLDTQQAFSTNAGDTANIGVDNFTGVSSVRGSAHDDVLLGSNSTSGSEQFRAQAGNDTIDGRGGTRDEADYRNSPGGIFADLSGGLIGSGTVQDGYGTVDTLTNIERIRGSEFSDTIIMDDGNNRARGQSGDDTIEGRGGNDDLQGGADDDTIFGGTGDDSIRPGSGDDTIDGGADFDSVGYRFDNPTSGFTYTGGTASNSIAVGDAQIVGDASIGTDDLTNIERVEGTDFADVYFGGDADENFDARGGDDTLDGGAGSDFLQPGAGNDTVIGGSDFDTVSYEFSNPTGGITYTGGTGGNGIAVGDGVVNGDPSIGTDTLSGVESISGTSFADTFTGGDADENFNGFDGDDMLFGGGGNDFINPGAGDDTADGGVGDFDNISYEFSNPTSGFTYTGGLGGAPDIITGDASIGTDTVSNFEAIEGTDFADIFNGGDVAFINLNGRGGDDQIFGGDGDDFIAPGSGDDTIDGGVGFFDTLDYQQDATGGITYTGGTGGAASVVTGDASIGTDTITNIEEIRATDFADVITAGDEALSLVGNGGDDILTGGTANDFFRPGSGDDTIDGGGGSNIVGYDGGEATGPITYTGGTGLNGIPVGDAVVTGDASIGTDTLTNFNQINGTDFADIFLGGSADLTINAEGGDDTITFGTGAEFIRSGAGNDTIITIAGGGSDTVDDFQAGVATDDVIDVSAFGFESLNGAGLRLIDFASDDGFNTTIDLDQAAGGDELILNNVLVADLDASDFIFAVPSTITGTPGDDNLVGTGGNDTIDALAGNDTVDGGFGNDTIFGGDDNDTLDGGAGDDTIDGGTGINIFIGGAGDDQLIGGTRGISGQTNISTVDVNFGDYSSATAGITVVHDGALGTATSTVTGDASVGNDTLSSVEIIIGTDFDDSYTVNAGFESQFGTFSEFRPGAGNDTITSGFDTFTRVGYTGALDSVTVDLETQTAQSTNAGDTANIGTDTFSGVVSVRGSSHDDFIFGSNDTSRTEQFRGEAGADTIDGRAGTRDEADYRNAPSGIIADLSGGAIGTGTVQDGYGTVDSLINIERVRGSEFADTITMDDGANRVRGVGGDDTINTLGGNDFIQGGQGDDTIDGGADFDTAQYAFDSSITGGITYTGGTGVNGIAIGDGQVVGDASVGTDDLTNIEAIDGTEFADTFFGGSVDDNFTGRGGDDIINGGGGFDFIQPGAGDDTVDGGADFDTVSYQFSNPTGGITFTGGTGLNGIAVGDGQVTGDASIGTDDLTSVEGIHGTNFADTLTGGDISEFLQGNDGADIITGGAGNDTIQGNGGNDTFIVNVGDGADIIEDFQAGAATDDVVDVSAFGFESLSGSGLRLIDFASDDGTNTTIDLDQVPGGDQIELSNVLVADLDASDFIFATANVINGTPGDDNLIGTGAPDTINALAGNDTVDGGFGNDTIFGGDDNDTLDGGAGDDTIDGGTGINFMVGGAGDDLLIGGQRGISGTLNTTAVDANFGNYRSATAGITVTQTGALGTALSTVTGDASVGNDTLQSVEIIMGSDFDDTYTVDSSYRGQFGGFNEFQPGAGNDVINSTFDVFTRIGYTDAADSVTVDLDSQQAFSTNAGDTANVGLDTFTGVSSARGSAHDDVLLGSNSTSGSEQFRGLAGNDTIDGRGGTRDEADYRNSPGGIVADLSGGAIGSGTVQDGFGTVDTLTNIERIRGSEFADTIILDDGDNRGRGQAGNDTIEGRGGNDQLIGGENDDMLFGGTGDDVIQPGSGDDTIDGGSDVGGGDFDLVQYAFGGPTTGGITYTGGTAANAIAVGDSVVTGDASIGTDTITNVEGVEGTEFADTFFGGDADENLGGRDGDDIFDGGAGNDFMTGGAGNDTFILQIGDGSDIISDFQAGAATDDVIDVSAFGFESLNGSGLRLIDFATDDGTNTTIDLDQLPGGDELFLENVLVVDLDASDFIFATSSSITGTPNDDILVGTGGPDVIAALAGNDQVTGLGGNDTIFGGDGNDILDGGAGDDTIDGGTGLNTFVNSAGDDTLIGGTRGTSGATNTPSVDANFGDYRNATAGITVVQTGALGTALSSVTGDASVGSDTLDGIEIILGSDFDDTYTVDATYRGQFGGFNEFQPGAGNDVINATFDVFTRVGYADALDSVTVDLDTQQAFSTNAGDTANIGLDTFTGVSSVRGSAHDDVLLGSNSTSGSEQFRAQAGNDTIDGRGGTRDEADYRNAPAGIVADLSGGLIGSGTVQDGYGTVDTLTNIERIRGSEFADTIILDDGNNRGRGQAGNDTIEGRGGDDNLQGGEDDDMLFGGTGSDVIQPGSGDDTIDGGVGFFDTLDYQQDATGGITYTGGTGGAASVVTGDASIGTDTITNIEEIRATDFADVITAGDEALSLVGNGGDDILTGGTANDFFRPGSGDDTIDGGGGSNIVGYDGGEATGPITYTGGTGLNGIPVGDAVVTGDASIGTDTLTNFNQINGTDFADIFLGGSADLTINAEGGDDTITFGTGAEFIRSGAGNDTIITIAGGGSDTVDDFQAGVATDDVIDVSAFGFESLNGAGLRLIDFASDDGFNTTIDLDQAAGGDELILNNVLVADLDASDFIFAVPSTITGTPGDDNLVGTGGNDTIDALAGNDTVDGGFGNDTIFGGDDNDTLDGGAGDDTIDGGTGINIFIGGAGDDQLIGGTRGISGQTNISTVDVNFGDYSSATAGITVVHDGALGTATSTVTGDASVGNDTLSSVEIIIGTDFDDSYTVNAGFESQFGTFSEFRPGAGNDTITSGFDTFTRVGYTGALDSVTVDLETQTAQSTNAGDTANIGTDTFSGVVSVRGSSHDDFIFGSNDTSRTEQFRGEAGADTIDGRAGTRDEADYRNAPSGIIADLSGGAIGTGTVQDGYGTVDSLINIERVRGSEFADTITMDDGANRVRGVGGDDTINTLGGNDFIQGGQGDDTIDGGADFDTAQYAFDSSITGGITYTGGTGVNGIAIGDGQVVGDASVGTDDLTNIEAIDGTEFADTFFGGSVDDNFTGRGGDDIINGGGGFDFIQPGAGDDTVDGGADFDTVSYQFSNPTGGITFTGGTGLNGIAVGDGQVTGDASIGTDDLTSVEGIHGTNFADTLTGGDISEFLQGNDGADIITGGAGNDTIQGNGGNDTFIVNVGDGADIIEDFQAGAATDDVVDVSAFGFESLSGSGLRLIDFASDDGTNTTIDLDQVPGGDQIELSNVLVADLDASDFVFATANVINGTPGDDNLIGTGAPDTINALAGNDTVDGGFGNDTIFGGDNNDVIRGEVGDDSIFGGNGFDYIEPGSGSDTIDGGAGFENFDTVSYRVSNANGINYTGGNGGANSTVDELDALSTVVSTDTLIDIERIEGTDFDDTFNGGDGDERFDALGGSDTVNGGAGFDQLSYENLQVGPGNEGVQILFDRVANDGSGTAAQVVSASNVFTDAFTGMEAAYGSNGDDLIELSNAGFQTAFATAGTDTLDGGSGFGDFVNYGASVVSAVTVNLDTGTANKGIHGTDTLIGFENVSGSFDADNITGNNGNNTLIGNGGDDDLFGLDGDDFIRGDFGNDDIFGGVGRDQMFGGDGDDTLDGGIDFNRFQGGLGNDTLIGGTRGSNIEGNRALYGDAFDQLAQSTSINSVDVLNDQITFAVPHGLVTGERVTYAEGAGTIGGLTTATAYFVIVDDPSTVRLALTQADALAGTDIDLTSTGTGGTLDTFNGIRTTLTGPLGTQSTVLGGSSIGTDTLINIDALFATDFDDVISVDASFRSQYQGGTSTFAEIDPGAGDDVISGNGSVRISYVSINGFTATGADSTIDGVTVNLATGEATATNAADQALVGNDIFTGVNAIRGTNFADTLIGSAAGFETFRAQSGDDFIDGGAGDGDRADYRNAPNGIVADLSNTATVSGNVEVQDGYGNIDQLVNIENIRGSEFGDMITGDANNNRLEGRDGDDTLDGGDGNDFFRAGAGNDTIDGGIGVDRVEYHVDRFNGDIDGFQPQTGVTVDLSVNTDGTTADTAESDGDGVATDPYGDTDTLQGIENVRATDFADLVIGDAGDNRFEGRDGADQLEGGGGNDQLIGGTGNDILTGDGGDDLFIFNAGEGMDTITDFTAGAATDDVIDVTAFGFTAFDDGSVNDVESALADSGGDVILDLGGGDQVTIQGVNKAALDSDDFNV